MKYLKAGKNLLLPTPIWCCSAATDFNIRSAILLHRRQTICTENVQYIRYTAVYLTTKRQIIMKILFFHTKHLAKTIIMFIFYDKVPHKLECLEDNATARLWDLC